MRWGTPLDRIVLAPNMQASRKLTSLSLSPSEFQIKCFLNISFKGFDKCEPGYIWCDGATLLCRNVFVPKMQASKELTSLRATFRLGFGMAWALQSFKSIIFLIEALRELTSLSLVILDAMVHPLRRVVRVPNMHGSRKLPSLSLGSPEL